MGEFDAATDADCFQCSGERPTCTKCTQMSTECHYETVSTGETHIQALKRKYDELRTSTSPYEELFEHLKSLHEKEGQQILRRIKAGADVDTLLSQIRDGNLLLQLALVPETRFRYEFPYISRMPEVLLQGENPYLQTILYEPTAVGLSPNLNVRSGAASTTITADTVAPSSYKALGSSDYQSPYKMPFYAAELVEPLLGSIKSSQWTSVKIDVELMRTLLSGYFLNEYPWFPIFHKACFLEDMEAFRPEFCSSLLVNSVFAYACVFIPLYYPSNGE